MNAILEAQLLYEQGLCEAAFDLLFDRIDQQCLDGAFASIDFTLQHTPLAGLDDGAIIGTLAITLTAKSRLACRSQFYRAARVELEARHGAKRAESLLVGLE